MSYLESGLENHILLHWQHVTSYHGNTAFHSSRLDQQTCWNGGFAAVFTRLRAVQCTVGAQGVCVHSVSWIRHLGMACGEMFRVGCSHNFPATAELPFANRPGVRADGFRFTCHTSSLLNLSVIFSASTAFEVNLCRLKEDEVSVWFKCHIFRKHRLTEV